MLSNYNEIARLLADDSFVAWIEGRATLQAASKWEAWIEANIDRKQLAREARQIHYRLQFDMPARPEVEGELSRLNRKLSDLSERTKNRRSRISYFTWKRSYFSAAAVILLLITVGTIAFFFHPSLYKHRLGSSEFIIEKTQNGQQKKFTLTDGSVITLNANSSLKYPAHYTGGDLDVWLKGEAYFEVVHDEDRTFIVNAGGGQIVDLGTKFNVKVDSANSNVQVAVMGGEVSLAKNGQNNSSRAILTENHFGLLNSSSGQITIEQGSQQNYLSWMSGRLVFDGETLANISQQLERIYSIKVQFQSKQLKQLNITAKLKDTSLESILIAISHVLDIHYSINDKQIIWKR